jgi:hypothetical protein
MKFLIIGIIETKNRFLFKKTKSKNLFKNRSFKTFSLTGVKIEDEEARILHFENYSLVYKIIKNKIYILAFWDNRQTLQNF